MLQLHLAPVIIFTYLCVRNQPLALMQSKTQREGWSCGAARLLGVIFSCAYGPPCALLIPSSGAAVASASLAPLWVRDKAAPKAAPSSIL